MEALNLLKHWRSSGGSGCVATNTGDYTDETRAITNTMVANVSSESSDGPYIDLELTQGDDGETKTRDEENEVKTLIGCTAEEMSDNEHEEELVLSPSDALFLENNLVSVDDSGILSNNSEESPKSPIFLLKSATKLRILFLKLKNSNSGDGVSENSEEIETTDVNNGEEGSSNSKIQDKVSGKFFAVRFNVEEIKLPLKFLFKRDSSVKENSGDVLKNEAVEDSDSISAKETLQKYLRMIKPFKVRVSKRYVDKLKFSGQLNILKGDISEKGGEVGVERSLKVNQKQGSTTTNNNNLLVGLKIVGKHLGKSRSASKVTITAAPPSKRRDDSLVQLEDGIQGAILHCKKSLDPSAGGESSSMLSHSVGDPARSV